jgi:hypothetical protein
MSTNQTMTRTEMSEARNYDLCRELSDELRALHVGIDTALARLGMDDDERGVSEGLQRYTEVELLGLELGVLSCSRAELPARLAWAVRTRERLGALSWPEAVALSETMDEMQELSVELLERGEADPEFGKRLATAKAEEDPKRHAALVRGIWLDEGHGELLERMAEHEARLRAAQERGRLLPKAAGLCENGGC